MTTDPDLKLLCDLINEPMEKANGWKKVLEDKDKNLTIHKKSVKNNFTHH